jgi:hypothetical protein
MAIPQRRRRVWLVGCADAQPSDLAEILFEHRSLVGDTPPRRRTREEVARAAQGGNPLNARVVEGTIALDGDKLKPRTDQRKGGNGFGINEENVGYTLTVPDRHGVAYASQTVYNGEGLGGEAQVTNTIDCYLAKVVSSQQPIVAEPMVFDPRNTAVAGVGATSVGVDLTQTANQHKDPHCVIECYEHHGQDARCSDLDGKPCPTLGTTASNHPLKGNNPLVCEAVPFVKAAHARGKDGEGERWEQSEVAGTRNVFDNGEMRSQEAVIYRIDPLSSNSMKSANPNSGIHKVAVAQTLDTTTPTPVKNQGGDVIVEGVDGYNKTTTGDVAPTISGAASDIHHTHGVIVSNSNGGDVMPTINANESKLGGDNQHINGGGYVIHEL